MIRAVRLLDARDTREHDEDAGFGALRSERGCLPLKSLDVRTQIRGLHAHTVVRQTFHNAFAEAIEATYIFPLPDRAAVTSFIMRAAGRVIQGSLRERQQARQQYDQAIAAGQRASIAEEERSGTFSLRVGNLPPGEDISVELSLVGPLTVAQGEAEFRFPLVVAPRYVPGAPLDGPSVGCGTASDTDQAPDASRVTPPVLLPGFPNPVRLSLEVEFELASLPTSLEGLTQSLSSSLHDVIVDDVGGLTVRLKPAERLNRDFILRFALAGRTAESMLFFNPAEASLPGVFALSIVPPAEPTDRRPAPRDIVFVLDRSGSMNGWKMVAARRAIGRLLDTLLEQDRFCVIAFDQLVEFSPETPKRLIAAGNRARWRTIEWLAKLEARGGTEMANALSQAAALLGTNDATREAVIVLVTDGQVAGEDSLLKTLAGAANGRPPRVFAVGIDEAVNAGFLRRLAELGRGACELVESEDRLDDVMDRLHRLTSSPVLRDVRLEPIGWQWERDSLVPAKAPDVFVDRPTTIFGRYNGSPDCFRLRVTATDAAGRRWQQEALGRATSGESLLSLWGRARVRELEDRYASQPEADHEQLSQEIVGVSLESHVLSRFTAYVAIDRSEVANAGGKPREMLQPVELPAGWDLDIRGACDMAVAFDMAPACSIAPLPRISGAPAMPSAKLFALARAMPVHRAPAGPAPRPPADIAEAVDRVATAVEAFQSRGWFKTRRRRLQALIDSLESLEALMRSERRPRLVEVSELLERARLMLAELDRLGRRAWSTAAAEGLVANGQMLLDELRQSPEPAGTAFWK